MFFWRKIDLKGYFYYPRFHYIKYYFTIVPLLLYIFKNL